MTREEVYQMVQSIGLPCAYFEFTEDTAQAPPFVVWFFASDTDVKADNCNYCDKEVLAIELYTKIRDFDRMEYKQEYLK